MIQFNLLPDVKLEYLKAQRTRRLVTSVSVIITAVTVGLLLLALSVDGLQKKHLSDLNRDVSSESSKLQSNKQLGQVLTVQNQLNSLTALHNSKPEASQLFTYLNQVTPSAVAITNFTTDFTQQTATITGTAPTLSDVNQYIDTLKATTYTTADDSTAAPAFSDVVLTSFGLTSGTATTTANQGATYTISLSYDQTIFDITKTVTLVVPSQTTTRLQVSQPTDLFTAAPATTTGGTK